MFAIEDSYDLFSFPSLFIWQKLEVSQNKNSPNGLIHSRSACFNFQTICPVKFQHATLKNSDPKFTKYILLVTACLFQIPANAYSMRPFDELRPQFKLTNTRSTLKKYMKHMKLKNKDSPKASIKIPF